MKFGYDRIGHTVTVEQAKRSCLDKVGYDSRNAARDRAAYLVKRFPGQLPQKPYRCSICHGFHLTTVRPGKGKSTREAGPEKKRA